MIEWLIIAALPLLVVALWPWIVEFMTQDIIPWIRSEISEETASTLVDLMAWIDKSVSPARNQIRKMIECFNAEVLGIKRDFEKTSSESATVRTECYVRKDNGRVAKRVDTEEIQWEELPQSIRDEMIRQNKAHASMDLKAAILMKAKQRLDDEGLTMEVAS